MRSRRDGRRLTLGTPASARVASGLHSRTPVESLDGEGRERDYWSKIGTGSSARLGEACPHARRAADAGDVAETGPHDLHLPARQGKPHLTAAHTGPLEEHTTRVAQPA